MMKKGICFTIMLSLLCLGAPAQKVTKAKENGVVKAFSDSLSNLSAAYFAYLIR